jgi:hypothetical protein
MQTGKSVSRASERLSGRSLLTSFVLHVLAMLLMLVLVTAGVLGKAERPRKQVDVVFHRAPRVEVPPPVVMPRERPNAGAPRAGGAPLAPVAKPRATLTDGPLEPGKPELAPGPEEKAPVAEVSVKEKVGQVGILAFRDQIASLARDRTTPRLGADARLGAADNTGQPSSRSRLATNSPGSSGGINTASLSRSVGGGGGSGGGEAGGGGKGGEGGMQGVQVGRATSSIAGIGGGGDDRPKSRGGVGPSRTDEEIQIVFDRYKASFYRLYNRELRNDPTLKGQIIVRLTIEPDGSVSMCELQSTDMKAPDLVAQVVSRVKTINFGAKEGVKAVTISYPIDFLPAQ